ncbi:hypothetical protein TNCV_2496801 [Trichonephila clavipes]|nr:hypothetical protein TNCV_2496801 [Trichonephila clavipes]
MTPLRELSVLCGLMVIGESKDFGKRRRIPFDSQRTSLAGLALESATSSGLRKSPRSAMQDPIQAPPGTTRHGKGSRVQSVEECPTEAHLEHVNWPRQEDLGVTEPLALETAQRIRRRRIPFDFQRTSLAGLALESATSSGLGRAPRSAMQDPIQAPPGTTRQAGLYTS